MHSAHCIYAALCIVQHNRLQCTRMQLNCAVLRIGRPSWQEYILLMQCKADTVHWSAYCILCDAVQCVAQITLRCTDRNCRHPSLSVASIPPNMSDQTNTTNYICLIHQYYQQSLIKVVQNTENANFTSTTHVVFLLIDYNAVYSINSRQCKTHPKLYPPTAKQLACGNTIFNCLLQFYQLDHISRCDRWQTPL